jgi:hypothetical protein
MHAVHVPCILRSSVGLAEIVESKRERTKKLNCLSIQRERMAGFIYRKKTILGEAEY